MYYNETVNSNIPNSPIRFHTPDEKKLKGPVFNAHFHNEIEILYVRSGIFTAYNDYVSVSAKAGEIIFQWMTENESDISIHINSSYMLPVCGIEILLILISVIVSSWIIVRLNPKEILVKMN